MSGPKVVRVVTKQEVMSICRGRIDALQDAIEQWRKYAARHDALTAEEEKAVERKAFCRHQDVRTRAVS